MSEISDGYLSLVDFCAGEEIFCDKNIVYTTANDQFVSENIFLYECICKMKCRYGM